LKTYDVDFQHRFAVGSRQSFVWGAGFREYQDQVGNSSMLQFLPARRSLQLFSGFIQDEISLYPDKLKLIVGSKLEHNSFSGFEIEPSARIAWTPADHHTVWAAVSRATRSPGRLDSDVQLGSALTGSEDFVSEKVLAYEAGYRVQPINRVSLSLACYFNQYDDLRDFSTNASTPTVVLDNEQKAQTWGAEVSGRFQALSWWRLRAGYTFLHEHITSTSSAVLAGSDEFEALDPKHQFFLQSIMDLPENFQLDLVGRYVDSLRSARIAGTPSTPSYLSFDARVAWRYKNWEISLVGQNLAEPHHREFGASEIPRGVFGKVTMRF
jgi:iron complex outermembrane receptor protein